MIYQSGNRDSNCGEPRVGINRLKVSVNFSRSGGPVGCPLVFADDIDTNVGVSFFCAAEKSGDQSAGCFGDGGGVAFREWGGVV